MWQRRVKCRVPMTFLSPNVYTRVLGHNPRTCTPGHLPQGHIPPGHLPPRHLPQEHLPPRTYTPWDIYPLDTYPQDTYPLGHIPPRTDTPGTNTPWANKTSTDLWNWKKEIAIYFHEIDLFQITPIPLFLPWPYHNYEENTKQNWKERTWF